MAFLVAGTLEFLPLWLKLILSGHRFLSTMPISKEQHDELCTSYAALALYDGDVSYFQITSCYVFEGGQAASRNHCCFLLLRRPSCGHQHLTNSELSHEPFSEEFALTCSTCDRLGRLLAKNGCDSRRSPQGLSATIFVQTVFWGDDCGRGRCCPSSPQPPSSVPGAGVPRLNTRYLYLRA